MVGRPCVAAHANVPIVSCDAGPGSSCNHRASALSRRGVYLWLAGRRGRGKRIVHRDHVLLELRAEGADADVVRTVLPEYIVRQLGIRHTLAGAVGGVRPRRKMA